MTDTRPSFGPLVRRSPFFARALALSFFALVALAIPRRAHALINIGPEGGLVKRTADSPGNLKLGFGYGAHAELDMVPLLKVGPYYLHSALSAAEDPTGDGTGTFNTLGLRARLLLPIPGSMKPYAFVGAGYTWVNYSAGPFESKGHFLETPTGVGVANEVAEIFHLSLDFAYRPGLAFGGDAYDVSNATHPSSGWSLLLGFALNL